MIARIALLLACLAATPAMAADPLYQVTFSGYGSGPVLDWLKGKGFVPKKDADSPGLIALAVRDQALVLEAKKKALGLLMNETDIAGVRRIRIEWGVDAFPAGASYDKGARSEAIMVYTFFGKEKQPSGSILVPDSPYFIGLFLCQDGRTDHPYTGRFFKAGGRYVCANVVKAGQTVVSEFDIGQSAETYFNLHSLPPVSGFAIGIDTDNAKSPATAKAYIKSITYF
ncbi:MAG: hypothetical protein U1E53_08685 [Dongiaceae bacterium]